MIPQSTIQHIKDRANDDIVDIIGRYIKLKQSGNSYKAKCPYHDENTPSFSVSEDKGIFTCFGCGANGDAVQFIMDHEGLDFIEAIRWLANLLHITIHEEESPKKENYVAADPWPELTQLKSEIRKQGYVILFLDHETYRIFKDKEDAPCLGVKVPLSMQKCRLIRKYTDIIFIKTAKGYKNETVFQLIANFMQLESRLYILTHDVKPGIKKAYRHGQVEKVEDTPDWLTYYLDHHFPDEHLKTNIQKVIARIDNKLTRSIYTQEFINRWNTKLEQIQN